MKLSKWRTAFVGYLLVITAFSMGTAPQAIATSITLDQSSQYFLGVTNGEPSSEALEATYINFLIDMTPGTTGAGPGSPPQYQRSSNVLCYPTCPDATTTGEVTPSGTPTSGSFGTGFTYLLGKYDGPNFGDAIWYVANLTGDFVIPDCMANTPGGTCYGLSHVAYFNPGTTTGTTDGGPGVSAVSDAQVPEPSSFLLLGSGLLFLARSVRRKFQ